MKIGILITAAGVETTITLNYCPQYVSFIAGTQLQKLVVTVEGDGTVCDLDADGLDGIGNINRFGAVADSFIIPLADGLLTDKVTTLVFTNSAAQTPNIYAWSTAIGAQYVKSYQTVVLANSAQDVVDFAYLVIKDSVAADIMQASYDNGINQRFEDVELKAMGSLQQNGLGSFFINNLEGLYKKFNINPSTNRTIYTVRYMAVGVIS